jgi:Lrp/AsnC family leucine-responsive transcriptional regulator
LCKLAGAKYSFMDELNRTDRRLLAALQADGRSSYQELGEAVGLSAAAAYQRVRKLEAAGVITGYHARVNPDAARRPLVAFVRVRPGAGANAARLITEWRRSSLVQECHRLSGPDQYLLKLRLDGVATLVEFLDRVRMAGCRVESEVALETTFERWEV